MLRASERGKHPEGPCWSLLEYEPAASQSATDRRFPTEMLRGGLALVS